MQIQVTIVNEAGRPFQLRWVDPTSGKRHKRSTKTRSRDKANRMAAQLEQELQAGHTPGETSWDSFRLRFEDEHLATRKESTAANYCYALERFARDVGKPKQLSNITSSVLSTWAAKMRADGLREASIGSNLRFLKSALSWAQKMGLINSTPVVIMPGAAPRRGRAVSIFELVRFLRSVRDLEKNPTTGDAMVHLCLGLWLSGLRLGEALKLSWDGSTPISINIDAPIPMLSFADQKNGKVESIPATPDFVRFLRRSSVRTGLVFRPGMVYSTVASRLILAGKNSGVKVSDRKWITAHDLRRTFGQRWSLRVHPIVLQAMMRHSTIETTLRYYVSIDRQNVIDALWNPVVGAAGSRMGLLRERTDPTRKVSPPKNRAKTTRIKAKKTSE
jgi:integrase